MRITCKCLTEQGEQSLKLAIEDNKKELMNYTPEQRKAFFNTWKEIIYYSPYSYTLLLRVRSALGSSYYITKRFTNGVDSAKVFNKDLELEFTKIVNEITTAMLKNGSQKDIDFTIEVYK